MFASSSHLLGWNGVSRNYPPPEPVGNLDFKCRSCHEASLRQLDAGKRPPGNTSEAPPEGDLRTTEAPIAQPAPHRAAMPAPGVAADSGHIGTPVVAEQKEPKNKPTVTEGLPEPQRQVREPEQAPSFVITATAASAAAVPPTPAEAKSVCDAGQPTPQAVSPHTTVTISIGHKCYILEAEGRQPITIRSEVHTRILGVFVGKILAGGAHEPVPREDLHQAVWLPHRKRPDKAPNAFCQVLRHLNQLVGPLVDLPKEERLFTSMPRRGVYLNDKVTWRLSEKLIEFLQPASDREHSWSPHDMAKTVADKGQSVPRRSINKKARRHSDDD